MDPIMYVVTSLSAIFMLIGFWVKDLVVWVIDTMLWIIWTYLAITWIIGNTTITTSNPYMPEAVGLLGVGMVVLCIYEDFSTMLATRRSRPIPPTYDEEVEHSRQRIYNITRRR